MDTSWIYGCVAIWKILEHLRVLLMKDTTVGIFSVTLEWRAGSMEGGVSLGGGGRVLREEWERVQRKGESQGSGAPPGRGKTLRKIPSSKARQGTMSTSGSQGAVGPNAKQECGNGEH